MAIQLRPGRSSLNSPASVDETIRAAMIQLIQGHTKDTALEHALSSIKGILMNHYRIDAERAFAMLRHLSQNDNIPVRTIAQQIIDNF